VLSGSKEGDVFGTLDIVSKGVDEPGAHVVDREIGGGADTGRRKRLKHNCRLHSAQSTSSKRVLGINCSKTKASKLAQDVRGKVLFLIPLLGMWGHVLIGKVGGHLVDLTLLVTETQKGISSPTERTRRGGQ